MSYQTVTDINLGSQTDLNYQMKDLVKSSESYTSPSTSFEELVSYYRQNDTKETDSAETDKPVNKSENEKVESKKDEPETSEEVKKSENGDKTEKSEKVQEQDKTEKQDEKVSVKKDEVKSSASEELKETLSQKVRKDDPKSTKSDKNKKLSEKDFSRIQHIGEENPAAKDFAKVLDKEELKDKKAELEIEDEKNEEVLIDDGKNATLNELQNQQNNNNFNNSSKKDDSDKLDLFSKSEKTEKVFLDKDKKIEVQDLRSEAGKIADAVAENKPKMKVSEPKLVNENTAQITIELNQNANANVLSTNSQTAAANGSNFQAMLNNQIQQAAPEFVKAGNLILKDNNQGTINLVLRPDDLGNVKLHLSLDGKNISGHITVATKEALEVFKDNAETLREAFIKNGFDSASFDVSFGSQGGFSQEMAFEQQNDGSDIIAKRAYGVGALSGEQDGDLLSENIDINHDYSINIVA